MAFWSMTRIGDIGIGIFILIILWIVTLFILVHSVRSQNNVGWITLAISTCITVTLVIIPTDSKYKDPKSDQDSDYRLVYKTILLIFLIVSSLLGAIFFFFIYCMKPIHSKLIDSF